MLRDSKAPTGLWLGPQTVDMMGTEQPGPAPQPSPGTQGFCLNSVFLPLCVPPPCPKSATARRVLKARGDKRAFVPFPHFPVSASEIREGPKLLFKPDVVHLPKVTAPRTALPLCARRGTVPKEGRDNIACLKEVLQETFNTLGCTLLAGRLFSTSAEWYSLLTTISYLQI